MDGKAIYEYKTQIIYKVNLIYVGNLFHEHFLLEML